MFKLYHTTATVVNTPAGRSQRLLRSRAEFRGAKLVEPALYEKQKKKTECYSTPLLFWLPLLGSNQRHHVSTMSRKASHTSLPRPLNTVGFNKTRQTSVMPPSAASCNGRHRWFGTQKRKAKRKSRSIDLLFVLAPPAGLEPATS